MMPDQVHKLLYADAGTYTLVRRDLATEKKNFVGFVATTDRDKTAGPVEIVIAWRGTISQDEWVQVQICRLKRYTPVW